MVIMLYVRPWDKSFFRKLIKYMYPHADVIIYSDFRDLGDIWTGDYIYTDKNDQSLSENLKHEIITRCRFLRKQGQEKAEKLCERLYRGIEDLFSRNKFDMVLMPLVDCYTLDIIERVARENEIPIISFVGSFIKGYSRFTIRGERNDLRKCLSNIELESIYEMLLKQTYQPDFSLLKKLNTIDVIKKYIRKICKEKIYYPLKKQITRDPDNYHYNTLENEDITLREAIKQIKSPLFQRINSLPSIDRKQTVYMPLHYTPEATVDYWSQNADDSYYEDRVEYIVKSADDNILFLIKEHPAMMGGRRSSEFYKRLGRVHNVILIHPYENSNRLLDMVDTVVVFTGSVGVEALLRNKRVLSFTKNYYSDIHPNITIVEKVTQENIEIPLVNYDGKVFLRDLLKGFFPYHYAPGGEVEKQSDSIGELAKWCKAYYCQLITAKGV